MTDLTTPTSTRRRISVLPAELQPGDEIRDRGILRTISRVVLGGPLRGTVDVRFEPVADKPDGLGIDATVTITAWRMDS